MTRGAGNPFPLEDGDRRSIWDMLVARDIAAFLAGDWGAIADDFVEGEFVGHVGAEAPDRWRIGFPTLSAYRDEWLRQSAAFSAKSPADEDKSDFLFRASRLRDIEIAGERAVACKKFDGRTRTRDGGEEVLDWQTVYWLRKSAGRWRITGFLGYLPNPLSKPSAPAARIEAPPSASQHRGAGPYSPVLEVRPSSLVVISGQGPLDAEGRIVGRTIQEQAAQTLDNCARQLNAAGISFGHVFKVVVYLADMSDWEAFNEVYRGYVSRPYPVRTAVQAALWGGIAVEVDIMAVGR